VAAALREAGFAEVVERYIFFPRVRADVLAATQCKQRHCEDSSLTDADLFFRQPAK
jgi:hypothetical protein